MTVTATKELQGQFKTRGDEAEFIAWYVAQSRETEAEIAAAGWRPRWNADGCPSCAQPHWEFVLEFWHEEAE